MLIQIILVAVIIFIIIRLTFKLRSKEIDSRRFVVWLLFWLATAVVVIWPDLTATIANFVGIGRGSDLVVYSALMFLFYALFRLLVRIENLEKNLTKVVRQCSLDDYDSKQ